jgi:hypothetical protein
VSLDDPRLPRARGQGSADRRVLDRRGQRRARPALPLRPCLRPSFVLVLADVALRVAFSRRLEVRLTRPELLRVDSRDGLPVAESSSFAPPCLAARFEMSRGGAVTIAGLPVGGAHAQQGVSTGSSRRGLGARLGSAGPSSSSSARICMLRFECVVPSSRAARTRLPPRATTAKHCSRGRLVCSCDSRHPERRDLSTRHS